jgi:hypothetical protein
MQQGNSQGRRGALKSSTAAVSPPLEPFAVSPREAGRLGGWGLTRVYHLMNTGELESYRDGRSRKITVASIKARIARKVAEAARLQAAAV